MNIKSNEKKENSTYELVIEVGAAEFQAAIDKVYNRQKKSINVPGFRKGKALTQMALPLRLSSPSSLRRPLRITRA